MVLYHRKAPAAKGGAARNARENGHGRGDGEGESTIDGKPLVSASPPVSPAWRTLGLIFFAYLVVVSVFLKG